MAIFGSFTSTVFLVMVIVATLRYVSRSRRARQATLAVPIEVLPPVTVLKPVHGLEPRLEETLESFFRQDYPELRDHLRRAKPRQPGARGRRAASQTLSRRAHASGDFGRAVVAQREGVLVGQDDRFFRRRLLRHQRQRHPGRTRFPAQRDPAAAEPEGGAW